MNIVEFINENWETLLPLALIIADLISGLIPDRWLPYIGIIRRFMNAIRKKRGAKNLCILMALLPFVTIGCAGIQVNDDAITEFAIESLAMGIGYEMKGAFEWSDGAEDYYLAIMDGEYSLEAAQLAEAYLRQYTHPLIANRMVRLAGMIGFGLNDMDEIVNIDAVDLRLLQAAARGFKSGLELSQEVSYQKHSNRLSNRYRIDVIEAVRKTNEHFGMNWASEDEKRQWMQKMGFLLTDEQMERITPQIPILW